MKKILTLITLNFILIGFCQKKVLDIPVDYKSDFFSNKESLTISNTETDELVVFIEDLEETSIYLLDAEFQIKKTIKMPSLKNKFKKFLGYKIIGPNNYSIYFSNNNYRKFAEIKIDFSLNKAVTQDLNFKLTDDAYLESLSFKNQFFLISISKSNDNLNIYNFSSSEQPYLKKYNFKYAETVSSYGYHNSAYLNLTDGNGLSKRRSNLTKIDASVPNSIETASQKNKLYLLNDQLLITIDDNKDYTKLFYINPLDDTFEYQEINKPTISVNSSQKSSSYYFDDKLYQLNVCGLKLNLKVWNLEDNTIFKELTVKPEGSISFRNTGIIQKKSGTIFGGERELKKPKQFLRKMTSSYPAVVVYKLKDSLNKVTIGCYKEISGAGGGMPMMPGGIGAIPLSSIGGVALSFNPVMTSYGSYTMSKSVSVQCLFDEKMNHVQGEVPLSVFEKIKEFESHFDDKKDDVDESDTFSNSKIKLKSIFKHQGKLYLGFLNSDDENYHIYSF